MCINLNNLGESPRIAVHKQTDSMSNQMGINSNKIPRK